MDRIDAQQLKADVYNIVGQIPFGRVLTYGDIARLAGYPNLSRMVGHILSTVPPSLRLPCHRVVNASGLSSNSYWKPKEYLSGRAKTARLRYRWRNTACAYPLCHYKLCRRHLRADRRLTGKSRLDVSEMNIMRENE